MAPGDIYRHERFYRDSDSGELLPKYILFLAPTASGDWVARLLTSREAMRPRNPACYHGDPYPGFYLGVPGLPLTHDTWIDLRKLDDFDPVDVRASIGTGVMRFVGRLATEALIGALDCTAGALDTTIRQERALRDQLALLR